MANDLKKGINIYYKKSVKMDARIADKIGDSMGRIRTTLKDNNYVMTKEVSKKIAREFDVIEQEAGALLDELQVSLEDITITNIARASRTAEQEAVVRSVVEGVNIEKLSSHIHSGLIEVRANLITQLKQSISAGESAVNAAKKLLSIEEPTVLLPKYIKEIQQAARRAITDPKEFGAFNKVLKSYKKQIDGLTRAGEKGFEHLGIRRGSRAFTREIKKLTAKMQGLPADVRQANIGLLDDIVDKWAAKKALYIQQRVARTEGSKAYHQYTLKYAEQADHIIGIRVLLSGAHPDDDECNILAIDYYFKDGTPTLPPFHPNCLCYTEYIFAADFLQEERAA